MRKRDEEFGCGVAECWGRRGWGEVGGEAMMRIRRKQTLKVGAKKVGLKA